jgi:crotonobetainyl-CoA:carnitine CoA-transferase CaiB-like acyl-CoA transferase
MFPTKDGRFISLSCLQAFRYWAEACALLGQPELGDDPRYADADLLRANCAEATAFVAESIASRDLAEWRDILASFSGQWAVVQTTLEAVDDPQTVANGYVQEYVNAEGEPFRMVAPPVKYGGEAATPLRAPEFNEHGDAILEELGLDWDTIIDLKVKGVVA